jgi:hypothetical protein
METSRSLISINTKRWKQGTDLFPPHHGGMGGEFRYFLRHSSPEPAVFASQKFGCDSVVPATTV